VWQTLTHSTFNYTLTIHFTICARVRDTRSDWSQLCTDCSFSAFKYRHCCTLWRVSLWSTDSVLIHSSPGLQLITLHGPGLMKLYIVTNVKKSGLENEHKHKHSGRTLTIKQRPYTP